MAANAGGPAAWHVTGSTGGELWLLGSVHYLREHDHPLPAIIDELYARADTLVLELDLDDLDPATAQAQFLGVAMLGRDATLPDVLTPETYTLAATRARELGIDLALLERFEPWLVAITISDLGMGRLGYSAERGVEQYLLAKARRDGKEVLGLETLEAQIGIFDGLSIADQEALLEQTLAEIDSADTVMDQMIDAWRAGELDELSATLMEDFESFPSLYTSLVVNRNESWLETLEALLAESEPHLVVVGALHLTGEGNVVDLLAARGFNVELVE
jgi:uncharacterized protein YbaP (TraB family)